VPGETVTDEYRAGQLAVRADALLGVNRLWGLVNVLDLAASIGVFSDSAALSLLGFWRTAADQTVEYLADYRAAQRVPGAAPRFRPAPPPPAGRVSALIRGAALSGIINARRAGRNVEGAKANGLVKTLGDAGKVVMTGGRSTLLRGVEADPKAQGWRRVTAAGACKFCRDLAARGAVYRSERTGGFEAHGHCACTGEIVYRGA
jgi:hypothetical protein